jgi:hypothetical protein
MIEALPSVVVVRLLVVVITVSLVRLECCEHEHEDLIAD